MTSITLQFHADRREILSIIDQHASDLQLQRAVEVFFPVYHARALDETERLVDFADSVREVALHKDPIDTGAQGRLEFIENNPGVLTIQLGRQTESTLEETFLSSMTDDPELAKLWRKLRNSLKKSMMKGAWVVSTMSGGRQRDDKHPYTEGAKKLMNAGVISVGPTGVVQYLLD